jgi:hypothetical protein
MEGAKPGGLLPSAWRRTYSGPQVAEGPMPARRERLAHLRKALAAPGGAMTVGREILRFLLTGGLILATGVLLWMVG